ncbi:MAG TPA: sugar ABC transporter substrate-binding protein [Burkholderiales bacterium]|jgi:ribose transport system substrate-binding protein
MTPTIAVFTKNRANPAYAAARLGADRSAKQLGARTVHYVPTKPDDVDEQIGLIDAALAQRPDAVVLVPVHPTAINGAIRKIIAAGVPLIGYLNRYTEPGPIAYVGSDDYPLALRIAIFLCEHLERRGELVIVEGPAESVTSIERVRGFRDGLARFPMVRVATSICGDYQRNTAKREGAQLLKSGLPFVGVLAANDVMALGVIDALDEAGQKSAVVGVNAIPEAITAIKEGKLLATIDFDAMNMAALATEAAIRHLRGETLPREIKLPVQIVSGKNYVQWDKPFEERPLVSWASVVK